MAGLGLGLELGRINSPFQLMLDYVTTSFTTQSKQLNMVSSGFVCLVYMWCYAIH